MFLNVSKAGVKTFKLTQLYSPILSVTKRQLTTTHNKMTTNIAIGQMCATNDKEKNRQQVQKIVEIAVQQNANFVFLPECCDFVGSNRVETFALAEPLSGETVSFYKRLAKDKGVWLSMGGVHEITCDENGEPASKMNNSHIVINSAGDLVAVYRKLHMFDVQTPEFRFRESDTINGGTSIVSPLLDTPLGGGLGLLICYDLRFPEVSTILRKNGAKFLTYPSAFAQSTGVAHWEPLLRARAIENQCYVIAAAQVGFHNAKRQSYGHAMIIDPWGEVLAECDDDASKVQCKTVSIDLNLLNNIRERMPCFEHRRNDIYTLAPLQMATATESTRSTCHLGDPVQAVETEETPYFVFERHSVPKSTVFYETPLSIAFTNVTCVVPGHVLVATRRCVSRLKDLRPDEIADLFLTVCKCQRLLETYYSTTSSTVTVQDGEFAGQTVKHVHCHIMPRKEGDFEHNDQIYIELNRHDHDCGDDNIPKRRFRTIDERTTEANAYRKLLPAFKAF